MNGGFDAAIGNPPYVECTTDLFEHVGLETLGSRNLYSYMMENTINHVRSDGKYGFIVPLAAMYSSKMDSLQRMLKSKGILRVSNYGIRPAKIFKRAEQRVSIIIGALGGESKIYSTNYQRWFTDERIHLFKNIKYLDVTELGKFKFVPKISHEIEKSILLKICKCDKKIGDYTISAGSNEIIYHSVGRYWLKAFDFVPVFKNEKSGVSRSSKYKSLYFKEEVSRSVILALINSSLFYWYWIVMSAARDFTKKDIGEFPYDNSLSAAVDYKKLDNLVFELMGSYQEHSIMLV